MALREIIARFGFQFDQGGVQKAQAGVAGLIGQFQAFGGMIAGAAIVQGVAAFVKEMVNAGDELAETSAQLGVSTDALQQWRTAATFAGVEASDLSTGLRVVGKNALAAKDGSAEAAKGFKDLGVNVTDAGGGLKSADVLMREVGVALSGIESKTERAAVAQKFFGKAGGKLAPMFNDGAEGLDKLLGKLDELGGGISSELIPLAGEADDAFNSWEVASMSLKSTLAVALLPGLNQLVGGLVRGMVALAKFSKATGAAKSLLATLGLILGKVALQKFGMQLLKLARAAALPLLKFALMFLLVDDLIALFEGRGSVIGTFIDKIFGKGSAAAVVGGIKAVGAAVAELLDSGDFAAFDKSLEDIFGPPGAELVAGVVEIFGAVKEALDAWIDSLGVSFDAGIASVEEFFSSVGEKFVAATVELVGFATGLGKGIIDGIIKAIVDNAGAVVTALGDAVTGAIDGAKKQLGISSPSKLAADQVGKPIVEGVGVGAMKAASAAARMTASAVSAASGISSPRSVSAPLRGGTGGGMGGPIFNSTLNLSVSGGSASDAQIQKLRQGVRSELNDNRRATLDALHQVIEAPA